MFARVFAVLPLALLATASHLVARDGCSTGPVDCCNQVQSASQMSDFFGLFGGIFGDIAPETMVGLNCSPLSVVAAGGNSCTSQAVCCEDNSFNGLVNVGCTPVNINS